MNRKEFMERLEQLLMDIPQEERIEALAYYNGYFEDAGVENEERIIRELESPEAVAAIIKADIGVEEEKEAAGSNEDPNRTLKIVLLVIVAVLTSPLWLGALGAVAGVLLGVIGTVLGFLLALTLAVLAFYILGFLFAGIGISILVAGGIASGMGLLGSGLILLALALAGTVGCVWLYGKFLPWMFRGIISLCSRLVQGRRRAA